MKCLMFGLACDQEQFDNYTKAHRNPYSVAHYLFEIKLIQQLQEEFPVDHNYIFQSANRSLKNAWVKRKCKAITDKTNTHYLPYLNLPVIRFVSLFFSTARTLIRYHRQHKKDFFVMSTINYFPVALATTLLSRVLGYQNIGIFTDCSVGYAYDRSERATLKEKLRQLYKKAVHATEGKYDGYILFSRPMNELVNPKGKPWCVMEGFFNPDDLNLESVEKYEKFVLVYAGTIIESVGLQNLVQAFAHMTNPEVELHIYGEGDYKQTLQQLAQKDERIKFFGFVDRKQLFEIEKAASLMVNVRDPGLAYTRYSFPSKTFEYLASGTPFLSTRLACYEDAYGAHIYFIDSNDPIIVAKKVEELACTDRAVLAEFGAKARAFVLQKKIPEEQVKIVTKFIRDHMN